MLCCRKIFGLIMENLEIPRRLKCGIHIDPFKNFMSK